MRRSQHYRHLPKTHILSDMDHKKTPARADGDSFSFPPAWPPSPSRVTSLADSRHAGKIILIDDDADILEALAMVLRHAGYECCSYTLPLEFVAALHQGLHQHTLPSCIVCDVKMPGMTGLELQGQLNTLSDVPIIMMSGASTAKEVVKAYRGGIVDFLVKPFSNAELLDAIRRAIDSSKQVLDDQRLREDLAERLTTLTPQEREIARRVAAGQISRVIAEELGIALRTVKLHRSRMMEKLGVDSVEEFMRIEGMMSL